MSLHRCRHFHPPRPLSLAFLKRIQIQASPFQFRHFQHHIHNHRLTRSRNWPQRLEIRLKILMAFDDSAFIDTTFPKDSPQNLKILQKKVSIKVYISIYITKVCMRHAVSKEFFEWHSLGGRHPGVSKTNRLHADICRVFFIKLRNT